ncbi:MAG: hypothetical protein KDB00_18945 [Planctomycetales bacterium]|nr:hypothetical protein [Planctomycetales bacterium]
MLSTIKTAWSDDAGIAVSGELVLIAVAVFIAIIAGLTSVRDGVVSELSDTAAGVQDLSQSYTYNGVRGRGGRTAGSNLQDRTDFFDKRESSTGQSDNCIYFNVAPSNES